MVAILFNDGARIPSVIWAELATRGFRSRLSVSTKRRRAPSETSCKRWHSIRAIRPPYLPYGDLRMVRGEFEEGLRLIHDAVKLSPFDPGLGMNVGDCLIFCRRFEEATRQLESTLEMDERFMPARLRRGEAYALTGAKGSGPDDVGRRVHDIHAPTRAWPQYGGSSVSLRHGEPLPIGARPPRAWGHDAAPLHERRGGSRARHPRSTNTGCGGTRLAALGRIWPGRQRFQRGLCFQPSNSRVSMRTSAGRCMRRCRIRLCDMMFMRLPSSGRPIRKSP